MTVTSISYTSLTAGYYKDAPPGQKYNMPGLFENATLDVIAKDEDGTGSSDVMCCKGIEQSGTFDSEDYENGIIDDYEDWTGLFDESGKDFMVVVEINFCGTFREQEDGDWWGCAVDARNEFAVDHDYASARLVAHEYGHAYGSLGNDSTQHNLMNHAEGQWGDYVEQYQCNALP